MTARIPFSTAAFVSRETRASLLAAALVATACSGAGADDPSASEDDALSAAHKHTFDVGVNEWLFELPDFAKFHAAASPPAALPRLCHVYTYWDVAHRDPPHPDQTHHKAGLVDWFSKVKGSCDEVLVTFQGQQEKGVDEPAPDVATFEKAFLEFDAMLPDWHGKLSYTAWNEPNNGAGSGDGLGTILPPELAADYYMAIRKHCKPSDGCKVAAGDFATNGGLADDLEQNCASDLDPRNTATHCGARSVHAQHHEGPSYLDRYKHRIVRQATRFGLPADFRPEIWAYHPWQDVNDYIEHKKACSSYESCATRRFLESLGGSWVGAEIWDDEIGVGLQTSPAIDESTQACGAAFLVQLTELSPRVKRVYYMMFSGGNGPLFDGGTMRSAGKILAHESRVAPGRSCAPTGL